jgi:hypothetical protein
MAVTTVKPIFLNGSGVYQPVSNDVSNGNLVPLTAVTISETQSYPDTTNTTHAATIGYVNAAAAAAINGLDYKQAAQFVVVNAGAKTLAQVLTAINTTTGIFAVGDRILVNWTTPNVSTGIYVLAGSNGSWTWTRSADMAVGSNATGDFVFCYTIFDPATATTSPGEAALVCQQLNGAAVVGTNALSFTTYGLGTSYSAGDGIDITTNIISAKVDGTTTDFDGSQNITVLGVPAGFTIGGTGTNSSNVTANNLDTLTAGGAAPTSLHVHAGNSAGFTNSGAALAVGKVATYNGTTTSLAAKSAGRVVGVVVADAGAGTTYIANAGYAVLAAAPTGTGGAGDNIYVGTAGAVVFYDGLSSGDYVTKVGEYLGPAGPSSAQYVAIAVQEFGIKP